MEPLDSKLARLVHEGMVQAVPSPEVEDRVLRGLLARLPHGGPPEGGPAQRDGSPAQRDGGSAGNGAGRGAAARAGEGAAAGKAGTAVGAKTWALVAVLGATAVTAGAVLGGRREPEPQGVSARTHAHDGDAASSRADSAQNAHLPPATEPVSARPEPVEPTQASPAPQVAPSPLGAGSARTGTSGSRTTSSHADAGSTPAAPTPTAEHERPRMPSDGAETNSSTDDLAAEIQQIAAADRALARGDARRALQLAREHATAHPHGQLAVERTAIELGARCQLGEAGAAEAAAAFLRAHGSAPAAAKVRTRCAADAR